jgi:hypothetical protein
MGNALRLGTFCHENGHMICWWPDLYDYDYDSAGVGRFCIMAGGGGSTNPVEPCGHLKDISGLAVAHVLGDLPQRGLTLTAGSNEVYKFITPENANEYYLVENRQRTGRDANLPDAGLAIWHVDRFGDNSFNEMTTTYHFQATVVQADGRWDLENDVNSGDNTDLWKAPDYTACGPKTTPNTNWWTTKVSYLLVSNISASGPSMTFDYRGPGLPNVDSDGDGLSDWDETRDWNTNLPGVQNPFDPTDDDSTGNLGSNEHDGVPDGQNDYDGDGLSNAEELRFGSNPLDPHGALPASSPAGLCALAVFMGVALWRARARCGRRRNIQGRGEVL